MNKKSIIIILSVIAIILVILVVNKPTYTPSTKQIADDIANITITNLSINNAKDNPYPKVTIKGELPNDCIVVSDASINLTDEVFYINLKPEQTKTSCHKRNYTFSLELPLDITGLTKGTYRVKAGNKETELKLDKDTLKIDELKNNKLPTN